MAKPRIRLFRKVWDCRLQTPYQYGIVGFGFTPAQAYRDWLRQFIQAGLTL